MLREAAPRRASGAARRPAAARPNRGRIEAALDRCGEHERTVLAMLLLEGLTPEEAAGALDLPVRDVLLTFRAVMEELGRAARGTGDRAPRPAAAGRAALSDPRLRKA